MSFVFRNKGENSFDSIVQDVFCLFKCLNNELQHHFLAVPVWNRPTRLYETFLGKVPNGIAFVSGPIWVRLVVLFGTVPVGPV